MLTVKDEKIVDTEKTDIEEVLRKKMDELSDSVDCFDRISERVFAENKFDLSDAGDIVSDVENITGKFHAPRIIKWVAAATAAAAAVAVIPQTSIGRHIFFNLRNSTQNDVFTEIIEELDRELEKNGDNYSYSDVPLDYYIENDILVTPLFCCPFEECDREDANVRIFTKQIDGIKTTQVYAVLYTGTYTENNFIAAAESKHKFTPKEMAAEYDREYSFLNSAETAVEVYFSTDETGMIKDSNGSDVSAASFINSTIVKSEQGIKKISSEIIIGHSGDSEYFWDMLTYNGETENISRDEMWKNSVYFNGNISFPKESGSRFIRTDIFSSLAETEAKAEDFSFVYPYVTGEQLPDFSEDMFTVSEDEVSSFFSSIPVPVDNEALLTLKVYIPTVLFEDNNDIGIKVYYDRNGTKTIYFDHDVLVSEEKQAEIMRERQAEIEKLEVEMLNLIKAKDEEFMRRENENKLRMTEQKKSS